MNIRVRRKLQNIAVHVDFHLGSDLIHVFAFDTTGNIKTQSYLAFAAAKNVDNNIFKIIVVEGCQLIFWSDNIADCTLLSFRRLPPCDKAARRGRS